MKTENSEKGFLAKMKLRTIVLLISLILFVIDVLLYFIFAETYPYDSIWRILQRGIFFLVQIGFLIFLFLLFYELFSHKEKKEDTN